MTIADTLYIHNISIDEEDDPTVNYLLEEQSSYFCDEDPFLDPSITGEFYYIECSKRIGFSCLEALHQDGREL